MSIGALVRCNPLTHAAQLALFLLFPSLPSGPGPISPSGLVSLAFEPPLNPRISLFFSARGSHRVLTSSFTFHTLPLSFINSVGILDISSGHGFLALSQVSRYTMEDRRPEVLVVSIVFFSLATIFVALRFVSRIWIVRRLALHDYLMLLAWVCLHGQSPRSDRILIYFLHQLIDLGFSTALFYATKKGLGLHDVDIPVTARSALSSANYAFTVLYVSLFSLCSGRDFPLISARFARIPP